jgi:hypothetical protein
MRCASGRFCQRPLSEMTAAEVALTPIVAISSFLVAYLPISHTKRLDHACGRRFFKSAVKVLHARSSLAFPRYRLSGPDMTPLD